MGTWGSGIYENDHAMDLIGDEIARLVKKIEAELRPRKTFWSDVQGPLVYVDMLGKIGADTELTDLAPARVRMWRDTILALHDAWPSGDAKQKAFHAKQRKVVVATLDRLLRAKLDPDGEPPRVPAKTARKPAKKRA